MRSIKVYGALGLAAGVAAGGLVFAQNRADTPTNPFATDPAAPAAGKRIFDTTCIVCHGENGAGTERAPSLRGALKIGSEPFDIFEVVQKGINGTAMPSFGALPANDVWRVVSYVQSLSGGPTNPAAQPAGGPAQPAAGGSAPAAAPAQQVATGDAAAGSALFFGAGGCASCHEVQGRGSPLAGDLSAVGSKPVAQVRSGVLHQGLPAPQGGPFTLTEVTLKTGGKIVGQIKRQDTFNVHLQDATGKWTLLDRSKVASTAPVAGSGMPTGVEARLTAKGVNDVVAFLAAQKKRDWAETIKAPITGGLDGARIANSAAEPQNWLTYWGNYGAHHFTELTQITTANVGNLQAKWVASTPYQRSVQSTPLVIDGIMFTSGAPGEVYALDARTGLQLWKFTRKQDVVNPYQINPSNRGVAVLGNRVFLNTLDNNLIALDARTGRALWEKNLGDTMKGMTMTGAPLALRDKIVVGMSGGEQGVNGWLKAFDPATGRELWHFNTIPQPGEPGNETWEGDSWKTGAGATWLTGSYDVDTDTVIWPTGNPGPDFNHAVRKGDNLYSASVVALDGKTGKLRWHYQFSPNDSHDWDSTEAMVLADVTVDGQPRKVLMHADRNGVYYVLDRTNGKFIKATDFVKTTWHDGFDAVGRPRVRPDSIATPTGQRVYPAVGGTNWQAPSFDKRSGRFFLAFSDSEGFANYGPAPFIPGQLFYGRGSAPRPAPLREAFSGIKALEGSTGKELWKFTLSRGSLSSGVLGSRGGTLFAATAEGYLIGLDQGTGRELWRFNTGAGISTAPISYAVDGKQYIAVAAGSAVYAFALPGQ